MSARQKPGHLNKTLLAKLSRLGDAASRKGFLARHRRFCKPEIVEALTAVVRQQIRIDPHRALVLAEFAVVTAHQLRKPELYGLALRAKAIALYGLGRNKDSLVLYDRVAKVFEKVAAAKPHTVFCTVDD